jgi:hypothetical protein
MPKKAEAIDDQGHQDIGSDGQSGERSGTYLTDE